MKKTYEEIQLQVKDFFFMKNTFINLDELESSTLNHIKTVAFKNLDSVIDFLLETYGEDSLFNKSLTECRHLVFDNGDIWKNRADPHCRFIVTKDFWYVVEYDAVYAEHNPTLFITSDDDAERKKRHVNDEKTEDELLRELLTSDEYKVLQQFRKCQNTELRKNEVLEQEVNVIEKGDVVKSCKSDTLYEALIIKDTEVVCSNLTDDFVYTIPIKDLRRVEY
ncbi:hypothetical protein [Listeria booriae]|nr:hypothetical protein [Listeria booriae]MBC2048249.1 hypothetical protein [Listeria booriae]